MTRSPTRLVLVLACVLACGALITACGGSEESGDAGAERTLEQTFGATAGKIERGRLSANINLAPEGLLKLGGPIALRLDGPFSAPATGDLPRFALSFLATLAGQQFDGRLTSTGRKAFVTLDDRAYAVDDRFVRKLRRGLGKAAAKPQSGLKSLGIDPLSWIEKPESKGEETVRGVKTERVGGDVDAEKLLADVARLLDQAGGGDSLLTPKLREQITDAVKSAKVDVWSGADDHILRQIAVVVNFAFEDGQSPIPGLDGGRLTLRAGLDDVNGAPAKIVAPKNARPLSELTGEGGIGALLGGLGAGITGGIGPGAGGSKLLACITKAGGESVEIVRCVANLAP